MALNLQGFVTEPNQWAGLYHAADQLEKKQLKADQLAAQQQAKRNAAGTFLQNYLDPKDYLSGTQFDPMIIQGLQAAMKQGSALAASGADSPTLMMALGPMVNKITTYSTNAKNINKQVDDQIKLMKDSGEIGYDYNNLKQEALRNAFYKKDANGQMQLDPDQADPSVDWINKAIESSPERVTNSTGFDTFADKAKLKTETYQTQDFDRFGNMDKHKLNYKFQEYMVPEYKNGKVSGFVPKYDNVFEGQNPLMHNFTDATGKSTKAQVRVLDNSLYEGLPKGLRDNIRGQVKQHLSEYETATGEKIAPNSPKAKWVERALAYNELNRPSRNFGDKGELIVENKPSPQTVNVNYSNDPRYLQGIENKAQAQTQGRVNVVGLPNRKENPIETFGEIMNGNPAYLQNKVASPLGDGKEVIKVTESFPGGGLKSGKGDAYNYKDIYFDPSSNSFILEREAKQEMFGRKRKEIEQIPEKDLQKFMYKIARINNMTYAQADKMMKAMGMEGGRFKGAEARKGQNAFEQAEKGKQGWRQAMTQPLGLPFNSANQ